MQMRFKFQTIFPATISESVKALRESAAKSSEAPRPVLTFRRRSGLERKGLQGFCTVFKSLQKLVWRKVHVSTHLKPIWNEDNLYANSKSHT
ncbi:hypothetical protein CDAR_452561 [Caerostris darwini]|uniref:Uncharacterized protein n=1 Tax=Caerostris darwini TaxID=1538125 RepID=A0AAV4MR47_9ARAC|nr:hypothetical protein CDAR_452561 [Caerostris darwini]